jgi:DNA invertase Pin-like site-specific DNA recombinase
MQATSQKGNQKLAVAYIRVSTDTERQALGAQAQRVAIEQWAEREGVSILEWHVEQVSGGASLDKRLVLLAAIASVAAHGAGFLVTQRVDRFSRDPVSAALAESSLRKSGACLATADGAGSGDDPTSELLRGILLSVARFEKALIRARIVAALAVKRANGERLGAPRFGFRVVDGALVENLTEQTTKARLRELRASGLKLREILERAHEEGLRNRAGRKFNIASIHALVRDAA